MKSIESDFVSRNSLEQLNAIDFKALFISRLLYEFHIFVYGCHLLGCRKGQSNQSRV